MITDLATVIITSDYLETVFSLQLITIIIDFDYPRSDKDFKRATVVAESTHPLLVAVGKPAKPTLRILSPAKSIIDGQKSPNVLNT